MVSRTLLIVTLAWLGAGSSSGLAAQHAHHESKTPEATRTARTFTGEPVVSQLVEQRGAAVRLEVVPRTDLGADPDRLVAGQEMDLLFHVSSAETGDPLSSRSIRAWIDVRKGEQTSPEACREKIGGYLRGTLQVRPVVDLNSQFLLALNEGNTISVIDPLIGFDVTQFYTTVNLPAEGGDWALSPAEDRLMVTIPARDMVVAVSTETWKIVREIPVGARPGHIRFQPDGLLAWVSHAAEGGGVTAIDASRLEPVATIGTGAGSHDLAFTDDGRLLVSSAGDGTVAVIDLGERSLTRVVRTGGTPVALDWSPAGGAAYVADARGGIHRLDVDAGQVTAVLETPAGLRRLAFHPTGRWGFAVNSATNEIILLDGGEGVIRDVVSFGDAPDEIAFTPNFAYVRSTGTPDVAMIPLDGLGRDGKVQMQTFQGGREAPGPFSLASSMTPDGAGNSHMMDAIYVPNGPDMSIYYYHYMRGMIMPSGRISNWTFRPRSTRLVAHTIKEREDGVYDMTTRLEHGGEYDLVMITDEPRVVHCFPISIDGDPADVQAQWRRIRVSPVGEAPIPAGEAATFRVRLTDLDRDGPADDLEELYAFITSTRGWTGHTRARHEGEGVYVIQTTLPREGVYFLSVLSEAERVRMQEQVPARIVAR